MRQPTKEELAAIAHLRQLPMDDRELQQAQARWAGAIGVVLPIIHQVLTEVK